MRGYKRMFHLLFLLVGLVFTGEGLSGMIQTQDAVRAMVGEDARFTCQLTQPKNVLQITWKRILPSERTQHVATYNKRDGTRIISPFQGKVQFEDTGLQSSTIVVRNVTKADLCCYMCIFNAYLEGSIHGKSCLIVYEQPEPIFHITKPSGTTLIGASCSIVSHPTPTVTLEVSSLQGSSNYTTIHTANTDGTVTVTSTVTLERFFCINGTQVRCVVLFSSGFVKEASRVIYYEQAPFFDLLEKSAEDQDSSKYIMLVIWFAFAAVIGVVIVIIAVFGLFFRLGKKRTRSDPLKQTPQTTKQESKKLFNALHTPVNTQALDIS